MAQLVVWGEDAAKHVFNVFRAVNAALIVGEGHAVSSKKSSPPLELPTTRILLLPLMPSMPPTPPALQSTLIPLMSPPTLPMPATLEPTALPPNKI